MTTPEILSLLSQGGAAGAVIIVVFLFLRQQEKSTETIQAIAANFSSSLEANEVKVAAKLAQMTLDNNEQHKQTHAQIEQVIRDQIAVNTKLMMAIESLQRAFVEVQYSSRCAYHTHIGGDHEKSSA